MLSSRLVQLIEDRSDDIGTTIVQQIRRDPRLPHVSRLSESELRGRARDILKHLGHWLLVFKEQEVATHFERIGAHRHEEGIPLCEVALAYQIVKTRMIQFLRDQGIGPTIVEIYGEEELEHSIGLFFDAILYHMVKGYEDRAHLHPRAKAASA